MSPMADKTKNIAQPCAPAAKSELHICFRLRQRMTLKSRIAARCTLPPVHSALNDLF